MFFFEAMDGIKLGTNCKNYDEIKKNTSEKLISGHNKWPLFALEFPQEFLTHLSIINGIQALLTINTHTKKKHYTC